MQLSRYACRYVCQVQVSQTGMPAQCTSTCIIYVIINYHAARTDETRFINDLVLRYFGKYPNLTSKVVLAVVRIK
jgi:hypothetical protein